MRHVYLVTLFDYCPPPPPPPPLRAAVRSLVLVLHGFGTSTLRRFPSRSRGDARSIEVEREGARAGEGHKRGWGEGTWEDDILLLY